ncbi:MAG: hypothetical protein FWD71_05425 [Oscillospiraceae bacterium]|nr:hypothetical protein [Oscillospiraceae bacterium]
MVKSLKCLNCGADLKFNPTLQKWKCEWCDSEYTEKDLDVGAEGTNAAADNSNDTVEFMSDADTKVYKCSYCGGEVFTDNVTSATFCVYCQRPITLGSQLSGVFKPDVVIPFQNTKDEALSAFKNYLKNKRFVPDAYKSDQNIEKLTGVYIPFWLYNGDVGFNMQGEGDIVTVRRSGNYEITKTDVFGVSREGAIHIEDIPVDASSRTPDDIMDSIEPFDFSKLTEFSSNYLSGFLAERYDEDRNQVYDRAKERFDGSAENKIKASLHKYAIVRRTVDKKRVDNVSSKYGLLPVWILYSNFKDKQYIYAMNGQTGKIIGNLPIDGGKVFRYAALVFLISGVLCGLADVIFQLLS